MQGQSGQAGAPARVPRVMRAAQVMGPRQVRVREVLVPVPGPDEVLIRVEGCGLCGSNLPVWQGRPWFEYPLEPGAPGHESWGEIVDMGPVTSSAAGADQALEIGNRVVALAEQAFAEYVVARRDATVRIPAALAGKDLPGEPIACAMNALGRSDIRPGHWVAVIGIGFLGALLVQLARQAGARVLAVSHRPFSVRLARALGADQGFLLGTPPHRGGDGDDDIVARVLALTGGQGCDRVIEATGLQRPLDLATRLTRTRGRLVIAGFHQDGPRQVDMQTWNWRGIDVINAHERDPRVYVEGMRAALDAVQSGAVDLEPVLTHRLALDRIEDAFRLLEERPVGFVKAEVLM